MISLKEDWKIGRRWKEEEEQEEEEEEAEDSLGLQHARRSEEVGGFLFAIICCISVCLTPRVSFSFCLILSLSLYISVAILAQAILAQDPSWS